MASFTLINLKALKRKILIPKLFNNKSINSLVDIYNFNLEF